MGSPVASTRLHHRRDPMGEGKANGGGGGDLSNLKVSLGDASRSDCCLLALGPRPAMAFGHRCVTDLLVFPSLERLQLARNQEALSGQIDALRETVEAQGRLVERLLASLESQGASGNGDLGVSSRSGGGSGKKKSGKQRDAEGGGGDM